MQRLRGSPISASSLLKPAVPAVTARYVRLTYPDHYNLEEDYPKNFVFTEEAQVFAP